MKIVNASPSKATIILIHGAFEHSGRYETLVETFQKDGYSVIYGDLPGQGIVEGKPGHIQSFDDYIKTVDTWIKASRKDQPIFILGHSMGGVVAIRAMQELQPKVNGVILSSPAAGILNGAGQPLEAVSHVINKVAPALRVKSPMKPEVCTRNRVVVEKSKQDPLMLDKVSVRWYREFRLAIKQAFQNLDSFPDVPLVIMQAGDDKMVDVKKTKAWFNGVDVTEKTYKEWPGLYHELFNEPEWEDVYDYTVAFIDRHV
ncbi:alpha/beta hydrolase [Halobacillus fulvus]|nr:alpha/beta hydrolase [Halobacillus fulvus]